MPFLWQLTVIEAACDLFLFFPESNTNFYIENKD